MKRCVDLFFSILGMIVCLPLLLLFAFMIKLDSKGHVFYKQVRVGKGNRDFKILKFRTMKENSDSRGLLTIGSSDGRITNIGRFMRKYKIDELPQFINILKGDMSLIKMSLRKDNNRLLEDKWIEKICFNGFNKSFFIWMNFYL